MVFENSTAQERMPTRVDDVEPVSMPEEQVVADYAYLAGRLFKLRETPEFIVLRTTIRRSYLHPWWNRGTRGPSSLLARASLPGQPARAGAQRSRRSTASTCLSGGRRCPGSLRLLAEPVVTRTLPTLRCSAGRAVPGDTGAASSPGFVRACSSGSRCVPRFLVVLGPVPIPRQGRQQGRHSCLQ